MNFFFCTYQTLTWQSALEDIRYLSFFDQSKSWMMFLCPLKTKVSSPSSTLKILIIVLLFFEVQAAARYCPSFEKASLRQP